MSKALVPIILTVLWACLAITSAFPYKEYKEKVYYNIDSTGRFRDWKDVSHELLALPSEEKILRLSPPPEFTNRIRRQVADLIEENTL